MNPTPQGNFSSIKNESHGKIFRGPREAKKDAKIPRKKYGIIYLGLSSKGIWSWFGWFNEFCCLREDGGRGACPLI
jgi:hypothetical protein